MQPKIYESDYPEVFLPSMSIFHYLMPDGPGISPLPHFDPSLPCVIEAATGRTVSRGEMENTALRLGQGLRDAGMRRGDVVNLFAPNSIEFAFATWGTIAAGCTITPANVAYEPRELAHQVNDSGASFFFVAPSHLPVFERARALFKRPVPDSRIVLCCDVGPGARGSAPDKYRSLHELLGARAPAERFETEPMATAFMFYSSGTTGLPKGVETTHYNQTTQMQTAGAHIEQFTTQDRILAFLPMSHMYGAMMFLLIPLRFGCASVLLPQFEEIAVYKAIQEYKITVAPVVPPVLVLWASSPHLKKYDLSSLRSLLSAAAVLSPDVVRQLYKILPVPICDGYGMTETSPAIIVKDNRMSTPDRIGWMGRLLPSYQARLVCEDGTDAPVGTPGELWVRGPNVMKGYHNNPTATAATFSDGWFMTGDVLVRSPDGWYKVVDRVKELIKYKGFQVPPAELEALLYTHPQIKDAAVVGVYDRTQATELPTAYVIVTSDVDKSEGGRAAFNRDLQAWVAARAARHKRLGGGVYIVDELPKSPSGKVLRRFLRDKGQADRDAGNVMAQARL